MGSGTRGTMNRIRTGSFLTVLRLGFGTANPNAFTAYFLPKYACLPSHLPALMAKKQKLLTFYSGNQGLHRKRALGQLLADYHFIPVSCLQCTFDLSACQ
jgi:hypothetical protein